MPGDLQASRRPVRAFAPGKLILFGEHAVVYGYPAIATAVDLGTAVSLQPQQGPTSVRGADIQDPRLDAAIAAILPASGVGVRISTELPVGRGMGSSAALAVALIRAKAAWEGRVADLDECIRQGFVVERIFHGRPSGIDHTVSARGGALYFRRGTAGPQFDAAAIAPLTLVVLDSGVAGDTLALVAAVRSRRPAVDGALQQIGDLVQTMMPALARGDLPGIGAGMNANHGLLQDLGVSTPRLDALVSMARQHGANGAKLAGAGGGGVVIAAHPEPEHLLAEAQARGIEAFTVQISSS